MTKTNKDNKSALQEESCACKFTPAPWRANIKCVHPEMGGNHQMDYTVRIPCSSVGRTVHTVRLGGGRLREMEVHNANAHLIAASPDLYEALQVLVDQEVNYMIINKLGDPEQQAGVMQARKALKKARGEAK